MTIAVPNGLPTALRLFVTAVVAAVLACENESPPRTASNGAPAPEVDTPQRGRKRMSEEGLARIREHEAFVAEEYDDGAGNSTVGYGHMVLEGEDFSDGLTEAEAIELFNKDVERVVNGSLDKIEVELTQNQIDALGSFIFNVGPGAFEKGLLPHINARKHEHATRRILKYVTGRDMRTGERRTLRGLVKRRRAEVALYKNPRPLKFLRRAVTRAAASGFHGLPERLAYAFTESSQAGRLRGRPHAGSLCMFGALARSGCVGGDNGHDDDAYDAARAHQ